MTHAGSPTRLSPRYGWLSAVIPADARRFRVEDPALAAALAAAGGELVRASPDVEICAAPNICGDARCAIVPLHADEPLAPMRLARGAQRLARVAAMRAQVHEARSALARHGYAVIEMLEWDRGVFARVDGVASRRYGAVAHRFPLNAIVAGRRRPEVTALKVAVAAASEARGRGLPIESIMIAASGVVVAIGSDAIVRVGVGPAAARIDEARQALDELLRSGPAPAVAERVPVVEAHGRTGLAAWSLERRLSGTKAPGVLSAPLAADCLEFLTALHDVGMGGKRARLEPAATAVAEAATSESAAVVHALGQELDERLADVPRGFEHGDFWTGNLLLLNGRLSGVVDWPSARSGALPLVDLLQLQANVVREATGRSIGDVVTEVLMPAAKDGGDGLVREYCQRIGLDCRPALLVDLVQAYWLQAVAHELLDPDRDVNRSATPRWREANVEIVLRSVTRAERVRAPSRPGTGAAARGHACVVTDEAELRALEHEWARLAESRGNPFVSPAWFWTWLETCGRGHRPFVPVLRNADSRLIGLLPLVRSGGRFGRLAFAGSTFGDYFHPVAAEVQAEEATAAGAIAALNECRRDWAVLVADYVDEAAPWMRRLRAAEHPRLALTPYHDRASTYRSADIAGQTWSDYLSTRSRNFRSQLGRRQRALERDHTTSYRRADEQSLADDMATLFELHRRRWGASRSTIFSTPEARAFHLGFARAASAHGWLRLRILEADQEPIAAWYGWRLGDRYLYYQAGFDPAWSSYSPGLLLLARSVRDAIDEHAATYDMLLGDEAYKARFADDERTARTFVVTRRAEPAHAVVVTDAAVRRMVRRLPDVPGRQIRSILTPVLRRWPIITAP